MENKKEEKMIYLKDLIFVVLRRWRAVLAVTLIAAVLLGGMQALTGRKKPGTSSQEQAALEQYEQDKADRAQLVEKAKTDLHSHQTYLADSLLMQLDPYSHYEAQMSIFVQTDYKIQPGMSYQNPDRTADILAAYEAVLQGDAAMEAMAKALETESRYISEVLILEKAEQTATLRLRVKLPGREAAQALLPVLSAQIDAAKKQVNASVKSHQLTVVEQSVVAKVDTDLADLQQLRKERITVLEKAVTDAEAAQAALTAPIVGKTGSLKATVKKAVIFAVLGAVLGMFLTVCILWVMHIASDRIYAARNLRNRTGVKVIGTVGCEKKNPVDRLISRWEGRSTASAEQTPAAVDICCRAKDAKRLLITGSGDRESRAALVQAVKQAMPGVQVADCGSILRDTQALQTLAESDAVVLVETCFVSCYSAVEKQAEMIDDYGAALLGCVLLEK